MEVRTTEEGEEPTSNSIQERAEQLLKTADAIQQSSNERKAMLDAVTNDTMGFSDSTGFLLDDSSMNKQQQVDNNPTTVMLMKVTELTELLDRKREKVTDLKEQLQNSHKALLSTQENANLKYRKLELQFMDLRIALESAKKELDTANDQIGTLQADKVQLEEHLQKSVGQENLDWLETVSREVVDLRKQGAQQKAALDGANRERDTMRSAMLACTQCKPKIPNRQASRRSVFQSGASLWNAFSTTVMGLNEEAEATPQSPLNYKTMLHQQQQPDSTTTTTTSPQPPALFQEQSTKLKLGLEADIRAMEQEMKVSSEPSRPRASKRRKEKKSSRKSVGGGGASLDAFFSQASQGLVAEEMDEEASFFSKSRSVHTAPASTQKRRKKKKKRNNGGGTKKSSSAATASDDDDDEGEALDHSEDRRSMLGRGLSLRDNFRAKMLGLDQEQVTTGATGEEAADVNPVTSSMESPQANGDLLSDMQKEVAEWGGSASHTLTVL